MRNHSAIAWPAPAKLNLFLHVTGQREDGYHELSTAFQFLDLADGLHFSPRMDGEICLLGTLPGVAPESNLVVRAARLLAAETGIAAGVDIRLDKRIPVGGGLGGGSSDAATTLVVLNRIWRAGLDEERLAALGLTLGADVPVFARGAAAWAEGVGEKLIPQAFEQYWYVVLDPGVAVSTAAVFAAPELTRDGSRATISRFSMGEERNDCEPVVRKHYPKVARALDWLAERGPARLTGTGGCLFGWYARREQAEAIAAEVAAPWRAWVARGCNRSPLLDALETSGDAGNL
ncbi:MAG: 4-(cytidine 5'-diphospho)-2-C-methyl-D-erythritol kinase [Gammaproteobacteria bacterium]